MYYQQRCDFPNLVILIILVFLELQSHLRIQERRFTGSVKRAAFWTRIENNGFVPIVSVTPVKLA